MSGAWYDEASKILGVPLKRHTHEQAVGPCPKCGEGVDRFVVWHAGNYWCRRCDVRGWWKDADPDEQERHRVERAELEAVRRSSLRGDVSWMTWNDSLLSDDNAMQLCDGDGMRKQEVEKFSIGLTTFRKAPALSFPVFIDGELVDVRMRRLARADDGTFEFTASSPKYSSIYASLSPRPFNLSSILDARRVLVVEGSKKAVVMSRVHSAVVGVPGARTFAGVWPFLQSRMRHLQSVVIGFDPDAIQHAFIAAEVVAASGVSAYVSYWPLKPDDFLLRYGNDYATYIIEQAERFLQ